MSLDGVAGMATRLRAEWSRVRILVEAKDFTLLQNIQLGSGVHPALYSMGTMFASLDKVAKAWI